MTKEEFKQYSELQEKFAKDVFRVIGFLKEIDSDLKFVDIFQLLDFGSVETHGWEYGRYQYQEEHNGFFDAEMLTWTDEQLREYVDKKIKERELVAIEKAELSKKQKEEEERREYERLKEKFGK
jgi:hypothetical protein